MTKPAARHMQPSWLARKGTELTMTASVAKVTAARPEPSAAWAEARRRVRQRREDMLRHPAFLSKQLPAEPADDDGVAAVYDIAIARRRRPA